MNERIRQLAEQAGLRFTQLMSNPMVPVVDGKETDLEKFAELIVRECADIATMNQFQYDAVGNYILKHFGVEQDVNETLRNRSTYFGNDI
jgi:hypothetical protein